MAILTGNENTFAQRVSAFIRFVEARDAIRVLKESGKPRPYTKDPILQTYHFCNIRRADDRVTKWIGKWSQKWPKKDRWFSFVVARWFNEPRTLDALPYQPWNRASALRVLSGFDSMGMKIFRPSYIITGALSGKGENKYSTIVDRVLMPIWNDPPEIYKNSIERTWQTLLERPGMGSFMAGQVVADWATFGVIKNPMDLYTWAPLGPGSARGLRWIYQLPEDKKIKQDDAVEKMRELYEKLDEKSPLPTILDMSLHDLQNCLCEFSKYVRGYSKTKYVPFGEEKRQGSLI